LFADLENAFVERGLGVCEGRRGQRQRDGDNQGPPFRLPPSAVSRSCQLDAPGIAPQCLDNYMLVADEKALKDANFSS
jgi:hypothetical protein